ncbi:MAG: response regulator transcription factor [Trueperaceae bacterium]|nr:response regulator transcription factor [Trueperaceae bacterium]
MNSPKVLIIEDEESLAEIIAENLREEGYDVLHAPDGQTGRNLWQSAKPNMVVLDVMLPYINGYDLCKTMREAGDDTPVLFLSARGQPDDRIKGLRVGGDDYLPKPFHLPEFLLRVQNMLRRQGWGKDEAASFEFAGHSVDYRSWTAKLASGREEPLGERELGIFRLLARRAGEVVSRDDILDEVWGNDAFPSSRTVDNFVMRLRKLFEPEPARPIYFHTIWGVGYKFTPEAKE